MYSMKKARVLFRERQTDRQMTKTMKMKVSILQHRPDLGASFPGVTQTLDQGRGQRAHSQVCLLGSREAKAKGGGERGTWLDPLFEGLTLRGGGGLAWALRGAQA